MILIDMELINYSCLSLFSALYNEAMELQTSFFIGVKWWTLLRLKSVWESIFRRRTLLN